MSNFTLNVTLNSSDFPEIGIPLYPKSTKEAKESLPKVIKSKVKNDYDLYVMSEQRLQSTIRYDIKEILGGACDDSGMAFSLDYEKGVPNTYKFLGMNINEDYQAVIPVGDGYVVVGEMFDSDKIIKNSGELEGTNIISRIDSNIVDESTRFLKSCSSEFARKVSTSIKSGNLYEAYTDAVNSDMENIGPGLIDTLVKIGQDYLNNAKLGGGSLAYRSILLNIVHKSNADKLEVTEGSDYEKEVAQAVLAQLFCYWYEVLTRYKAVYKVLSSIDIWQNVGKRLLGDAEFNSRLPDSVYLTGPTGKVPGVVSISGVSRNWDILDSSTNLESASTSFRSLTNKVVTPGYSVSKDSIRDFMISNVDTDNFKNPYELEVDELQAVANYDSLRFIDEDVNVHAEAYDLEDPDERGMFIKSVAKSYNRNLRNYMSGDVEETSSTLVDAMVNLVDKRYEIKTGLTSDTTSFTSEPDQEDSTYNVTSSKLELDIDNTKKQMLKVSKLIRKNLTNISKSFTV